MDILWTTISIAVTVAIIGVAAWVFVVGPVVVPRRRLR